MKYDYEDEDDGQDSAFALSQGAEETGQTVSASKGEAKLRRELVKLVGDSESEAGQDCGGDNHSEHASGRRLGSAVIRDD